MRPPIVNCDLAEDQSIADKIMDVLDQLNRCESCRFARMIPGGFGVSVYCRRGLKPAGPEDGCDLWARRV